MAVNKGGRGHTVSFESTHMRVPVPIKDILQEWVDRWKLKFNEGQTLKPKNDVWIEEEKEDEEKLPILCAIQEAEGLGVKSDKEKLEHIRILVNEFRDKSTHKERWKITDKLISEIDKLW